MLVQSRPSYASQNQKFGAELVISRPAARALRSERYNDLKEAASSFFCTPSMRDAVDKAPGANTQIKKVKKAFREFTQGINTKVKLEKSKQYTNVGVLSFNHNGNQYKSEIHLGCVIPREFAGLLGDQKPNNRHAVLCSVEDVVAKLTDADPVLKGGFVPTGLITEKLQANPFKGEGFVKVCNARRALEH